MKKVRRRQADNQEDIMSMGEREKDASGAERGTVPLSSSRRDEKNPETRIQDKIYLTAPRRLGVSGPLFLLHSDGSALPSRDRSQTNLWGDMAITLNGERGQ